MKKGRAGTMTHDYKRNGTTTLFAALNMLDGRVIGACMPRHRHREFLRFLKLIDQQTPAGLDLHLIVDNYATHKTPAVKRWIKAHSRIHLHFTPTSASWLSMVERFFAEITRKRIRRGAFKSVAELKSAILEYLENHNANPKPFVWTKSASQILEKVVRAKTSVRVTTLALRFWLKLIEVVVIRLRRASTSAFRLCRNCSSLIFCSGLNCENSAPESLATMPQYQLPFDVAKLSRL
jgi:transposase